MFQQPWYVTTLPAVPILLVHLAGIVVAIILLVHHRGAPSILALIGFGVLLIVDLANLGRDPLIGLLVRRGGMSQFQIVNAGVGCCCSIFDVAAIVCLIVAIWQAVSGTGDEEMTKGIAGTREISGEMPEETVYTTKILEETPAETLEEAPEETVETSEEVVEESE